MMGKHREEEECFESFRIPAAEDGEYCVHFTNGRSDAIRRMMEQTARQKERA